MTGPIIIAQHKGTGEQRVVKGEAIERFFQHRSPYDYKVVQITIEQGADQDHWLIFDGVAQQPFPSRELALAHLRKIT